MVICNFNKSAAAITTTTLAIAEAVQELFFKLLKSIDCTSIVEEPHAQLYFKYYVC